jgi:glycosyltransferase involved in cell wall biosynthesis
MIIGIDTSASGLKSTGTGRYINCLLEQLNKFENDIKIFPLSAEQKFSGKKYQRHYYRMFKLTAEMINSQVDCGIFPNYFVSRNFSKPSAVVIHDLSFITHPQFYNKKFVFYYKYLLKQTLKQSPLILTVSEHTKENINKYLNVRKENIFLLQAYSNINRISDAESFTGDPYFLYVGHIEPRKNLLFLVENFLKWKNESKINIKLKLIGEVWIKSKEIKYLLTKYGDHPDIIFEGYVNEEVLDFNYKHAFGFVHTSFEEGFGFPILEAMNYGMPVLCSNNNAAKEISSPFSVTINPYNDKSLINGFYELYEKKINKKIPKYDIKYSPELMRDQLGVVLDVLESRINKRIYSVDKSQTNEEAIEKTLLYSHLFNGGLHKKDLHKFLFDVKINEDQFEKALANLNRLNKINLKNDNVSLNYKNIKIYNRIQKKIEGKEIKKSLRIIKNIPFISCICFSGGTANYGIENHDDIDLFIITKPNSIFIVYLLIHVLSKIFNLRKILCANFLIDETNLEIKGQHDYYTAHQIVSLIPFRNAEMLNRFKQNNNWIKSFFPNFEYENTDAKISGEFYFLLKPLNKLLKYFYRFLYKENVERDSSDSIKLEEKCIKLYTNDHRIKILYAFSKEWRNYLETKMPVTSKVTGKYA